MNDDDARPAAGGRVDVVGHPDWMAQDEFTRVFCPGDPAGLADAIGQSVRWVWGADGQRWFDYTQARRWKSAQDTWRRTSAQIQWRNARLCWPAAKRSKNCSRI